MARRHSKEGRDHPKQASNRQRTMEGTDGRLHPAVDGQSLGERWTRTDQSITALSARRKGEFVGWLLACLMSQQHASVSQGRICTGNCTCCHIETEVADQTFCLTQSQYTDTGLTSPSPDPTVPGAWQGSNWSANF